MSTTGYKLNSWSDTPSEVARDALVSPYLSGGHSIDTNRQHPKTFDGKSKVLWYSQRKRFSSLDHDHIESMPGP